MEYSRFIYNTIIFFITKIDYDSIYHIFTTFKVISMSNCVKPKRKKNSLVLINN